MAIRISQMTPKTGTLDGSELFEISHAGKTWRVSASQIAGIVRRPTTRLLDLSATGNYPTDRKILTTDDQNVVRCSGSCGSVSVYIHDDVLAEDNFRTTIIIPVGSDHSDSDGYTFYVNYYDGSTTTVVWKILSEDVKNSRDIAYDILISSGEIIVVGQTDSDVTA